MLGWKKLQGQPKLGPKTVASVVPQTSPGEDWSHPQYRPLEPPVNSGSFTLRLLHPLGGRCTCPLSCLVVKDRKPFEGLLARSRSQTRTEIGGFRDRCPNLLDEPGMVSIYRNRTGCSTVFVGSVAKQPAASPAGHSSLPSSDAATWRIV